MESDVMAPRLALGMPNETQRRRRRLESASRRAPPAQVKGVGAQRVPRCPVPRVLECAHGGQQERGRSADSGCLGRPGDRAPVRKRARKTPRRSGVGWFGARWLDSGCPCPPSSIGGESCAPLGRVAVLPGDRGFRATRTRAWYRRMVTGEQEPILLAPLHAQRCPRPGPCVVRGTVEA
jgi:hypothetical protein